MHTHSTRHSVKHITVLGVGKNHLTESLTQELLKAEKVAEEWMKRTEESKENKGEGNDWLVQMSEEKVKTNASSLLSS